jgi:PTS system nitrogen regulatory IIA component
MDAIYNLSPDAIAILRADGKRAIFDALAHVFAQAYELDSGAVLDALDEREKLGSTGFGRGVAIPHARLDGLKRPVAALVKLVEPIDFDSADQMPVDLVFGLLSPTDAGATHLHALAAISRMMRDETMHEALSDAADAEALYALLSNATDRDAA